MNFTAFCLLCILVSVSSSAFGVNGGCTSGTTGPCINQMCSKNFTCSKENYCCYDPPLKDTCRFDLNIGRCIGVLCPLGYTCTKAYQCCSDYDPTIDCDDVATNCANLKSLCNDSAYLTLMTQQCPRTCGRCSGTGACVDKLNPKTGKNDCPGNASLCNDARYYTLMTEQCPRTCGRCSGAATTTSSSSLIVMIIVSISVTLRIFSFLCVLFIVFSVAVALDTCASEPLGPCIDNSCPNGFQCINNDICCLASDVNVVADQSASQESLEILNH
ncbi:unnamed protein product [Auanema sp. JU1783]|nr:unnamed protein product [Auanema sp. JU1783]